MCNEAIYDIVATSNHLLIAVLIYETSPAGPSAACHHARPVGETQAVQRDGQSPSQAYHEGEGAQETRCSVKAE